MDNKMFKFNQKGLSLVQALVTLGLLSGIGVMTMKVGEKQALHQKVLRATTEAENAASIIVQSLTSAEVCTTSALAITTPGPLQLRVAAVANEDDPANRVQIPRIADESGKVIFEPPVQIGPNLKVATNAQGNRNKDIIINRVAFGPMTNAGMTPIRIVDLWVEYTKTGILNREFNTNLNAATTWMKIDDAITVELNPAPPNGTFTRCYANGDSIISGVAAACASIGGDYNAATGANPANCNLDDGGTGTAGEAISTLDLENRIGGLASWTDLNKVNLAGDTMTGDLIVQDVNIENSDPSNQFSAVNLETAERILGNPDLAGATVCGPGMQGFVLGNSIRCHTVGSYMCPNNERLIGFNAAGRICRALITGNETQCPPGWVGTLEVINGGIEFRCTPVNNEYNCSYTGWSGGTNPCGIAYGPCSGGNVTPVDPPPQACCPSPPPAAACGSGTLSYTCSYASGGWSTGAACGAPTGNCNGGGTAIDTETACCTSPPTKSCSSGNISYTCDISSGWTPGAACAVQTPDCSTTTPVGDGDVACCPTAPNPLKCSGGSLLTISGSYPGTGNPGDTGFGSFSITGGDPNEVITIQLVAIGTSHPANINITSPMSVSMSAPSPGSSNRSISVTLDGSGSRVINFRGIFPPAYLQYELAATITTRSGPKGPTASGPSAGVLSVLGEWYGGTYSGPVRYSCTATGWSPPGLPCSPQTGACMSGSANTGDTACCDPAPISSCGGVQNRRYRCNTASGWADTGNVCGFTTSGKCSVGTPTNGETACCPASSPPTTLCSLSRRNYTCTASGWSLPGSNCGSTNGACTGGSATINDTSCCDSTPSGNCAAPTYTQYRCTSGGWPSIGTCASLSGSACSFGTRANNSTLCCASVPTSTCQPPPPALSRYTCSGTTWSGPGTSCTTVSGPCSGNATSPTTACCASAPTGDCVPPGPTYNTYTCSGTTWSGAGGSCSFQSGPCSGTATSPVSACCASAPSGDCVPPAPTYNQYRCNAPSGVGTWVGDGTCTSLSGTACNSGANAHNTTRCCTTSPGAPCGAPVKVSGGGPPSGGGCATTYTCGGGSSCIGGCPGSHGCAVYAGNCPSSLPGSACQSICTTSGNHSCYSGTVTDVYGRACQ